jgi:hypothetical protein
MHSLEAVRYVCVAKGIYSTVTRYYAVRELASARTNTDCSATIAGTFAGGVFPVRRATASLAGTPRAARLTFRQVSKYAYKHGANIIKP